MAAMAARQPEPGSDEQLLSAFARGDTDALGALANRHERTLLGLAAGVLGSDELAQDAVQEAWVRVIRHAATFKGKSTFKTWMYRIVLNRCKEIREKERRPGTDRSNAWGNWRGMRPDEKPDTKHHMTEPGTQDARLQAGHMPTTRTLAVAERNGRLRRAIDELDERKQMTILVCYHEGITHEVAAQMLGLPLGTLKSRLNAALKELRHTLANEDKAQMQSTPDMEDVR